MGDNTNITGSASLTDNASSVLERIRAAVDALKSANDGAAPSADAVAKALQTLGISSEGSATGLRDLHDLVSVLQGDSSQLTQDIQALEGAIAQEGSAAQNAASSNQDLDTELNQVAGAADNAAQGLEQAGGSAVTAARELDSTTQSTGSFRDVLQQAHGALGEAQGGVEGFTSALGGTAGATTIAMAGIGALAAVALDSAKAFAEEETGIIRLDKIIEDNTTSTKAQRDAITASVDARQSLGFSDDKLRESYARLIQQTGSLSEATRLQGIAMDVARGRGMDLVSASEAVGRIAEGNTRSLRSLGIVTKDVHTAEEGLAIVQQRFAGQAEAYGSSHAAAGERVKNSADNVKEAFGGGLVTEIDDYTRALTGTTAANSGAADGMNRLQGVAEALGAGLVNVAFGGLPELTKAVERTGSTSEQFAKDYAAHMAAVTQATSDTSAQVATDLDHTGAAFQAIPDGIATASDNTAHQMTSMVSNILDAGEQIIAAGTNTGEGHTTNLYSSLEDGISNIADAAQQQIDAMDRKDDAANLGTDTGTGHTEGIYGGIIDGVGNLISAAQGNVTAMDKKDAAGGLGHDIGSKYTNQEAGGVAGARPALKAEVVSNNSVLAQGMAALEAYRKFVSETLPGVSGAITPKAPFAIPGFMTGGPGAAPVTSTPSVGGYPYASADAADREAAQKASGADPRYPGYKGDAYGGTTTYGPAGVEAYTNSERDSHTAEGSARDAETATKAEEARQREKDAAYKKAHPHQKAPPKAKHPAAKHPAKPKSKHPAAKKGPSASSLASKANGIQQDKDKIQDLGFKEKELGIEAKIAEAKGKTGAAQDKLNAVTADYKGRLEGIDSVMAGQLAQEKAVMDPLKKDYQDASNALTDMQSKHANSQHSIQVDIHNTEESLKKLEDKAQTALKPLQDDAERAQHKLDDLRKAADATREAFSTEEHPYKEQLYDLDQLETKEMRAKDAALATQQAIVDTAQTNVATVTAVQGALVGGAQTLFDSVSTEQTALVDAAKARVDALHDDMDRLVAGYDAKLDPMKDELAASKRQDTKDTHTEDLTKQADGIRNLQAQLANTALTEQQRVAIQRELTKEQQKYNSTSKEYSLEEKIAKTEAEKEVAVRAENEKIKAAEAHQKQVEAQAKAAIDAARIILEATKATAKAQIDAAQGQAAAAAKTMANMEAERTARQKYYDDQKTAINDELGAIAHRREEFDYEEHQKELSAQKDVDAANKKVTDTRALYDSLEAADKAHLLTLTTTLAAEQWNDAEEERTLGIHVGNLKLIMDDKQKVMDGMKNSIAGQKTDIETMAKNDEGAAQKDVDTAKGVEKTWTDALTAYKTWVSNYTNNRETNQAVSKLASDMSLAATAIKDAAPLTSTLADHSKRLSDNTGTADTNTANLAATLTNKANPAILGMGTAMDTFNNGSMKNMRASLDPTDSKSLAGFAMAFWDRDKETSLPKKHNTAVHDMGDAVDKYLPVQDSKWKVFTGHVVTYIDSMTTALGRFGTAVEGMPLPGDSKASGPGATPPPAGSNGSTGMRGQYSGMRGMYGTATAAAYAGGATAYAPAGGYGGGGGGQTVVTFSPVFPGVKQVPTTVQEWAPVMTSLKQAWVLDAATKGYQK